MSDVDDLQNAQEAVAQREQERDERRRDAERKELMAAPVKDTAEHERTSTKIELRLIEAHSNMRSGELPDIPGLAVSIREVGLISPLLVRVDDDGSYRLVAGRRRLAALQLVHEDDGEHLVSCEVISSDADEAEAWVLMLTENLQRENPPPLQVARALRAALTLDPALSASALARSLGKSPAWSSRHLHLLDLPEKIQQRLEEGDLNFTIADLIRQGQKKGIIDETAADEIADEMASGEKSVDELKSLVRPTPPPPENYEELSRELDAARYGTREQGFEPDEVSAEQREWEAGADDTKSAADSKTPRRMVETAEQVKERQFGARQLEAYIIGRLLREHASPQLLEQFNTTHDKAYDFAWNLGTDDARRKVMHELATDMMDSDDAVPSLIFAN